jgi:dihydroorotase
MRTLIKNAKTLGRYLNSNDEFVETDLLIVDGLISDYSKNLEADSENVIEAGGRLLIPGLIDPQVHFREPGLEYKEDIRSGSQAANKGGFTTVISMPNTMPTADNPETVKYMWDKQEEVSLCRVYPTGAVTFGLKGDEVTDFRALKAAGAIALTDDGKGIQSDDVFREAMIKAREVDLPLLDHSEDESLSLGGAIHKGDHAAKYNVKGIDSRSESAHVERGCRLSGETGAHFHVLHISTKESIEHVKAAKAQGFKVTAEVSPHHLVLCDEDIPEREEGKLNPNWKMNPPLRSRLDRQACVEALIDGTIDAIATDHAPHAPHEKEKEIHEAPFGIIGLETAFAICYTDFVKTGLISLDRLVTLMTEGPASLFKLDLGLIAKGKKADLVLMDIETPEIINDSYFASKSKNSPFIGRELYGHAKMTILEGKIVYTDKKDF